MNQQRHKNSSKAAVNRQQPRIGRLKWFAVTLGLIALTAVVVGASVYLSKSGQVQADCKKLVGDWMRTDGDYVIRISAIHTDRTIQSAYFNPNPIHVGQAATSLKNDAVVLFVELQDAGYPGSTYNLVYKPEEDILQGTYFQAQAQELYDVVFLRPK
jgi:hypothetical protein